MAARKSKFADQILNSERIGPVNNIHDVTDPSSSFSLGISGHSYDYIVKGNKVAIISGRSHPDADLQEMKRKAYLMRRLARVEGIPLHPNTNNFDQLKPWTKSLEASFGGILLAGVAEPVLHRLAEQLKEELTIPVFSDDQDGTAIVVSSGLINSCKVVKKPVHDVRVVIQGTKTSEISLAHMIRSMGVRDITLSDSYGDLTRATQGADVLICTSPQDINLIELISTMNRDPILFVLSEPDLDFSPDELFEAGVRVISTISPEYPNFIENALIYPGIFRGALDVQATEVNDEMKMAVVRVISDLVDDSKLSSCCIYPSMYDEMLVSAVADAVAHAAVQTGVWTLIRGSASLIS